MRQYLRFWPFTVAVATAALTGCGQVRATPASPAGITPGTAVEAEPPDQDRPVPPASLWRDPPPPEALENASLLAEAEIPARNGRLAWTAILI